MGLVRSGWMMCGAQGQSPDSLTAQLVHLVSTTVTTLMMLECVASYALEEKSDFKMELPLQGV